MAHVPGLDGLRGLAVIGVLLFHANARLRGGYLGVDLFFVLSGFLITSILVEEQRRIGAIDLRRFWIRRFRRLMPALLSIMPAVALYAKFFARPEELAPLRGDALATLGYVANWRAILVHRSYWDLFVAPSPLEHTWSLAIEEQFYVVWPLAVALMLALARGGARAVRVVCVVSIVLALASAVAMALLYEGGNTTRVYLGTDTRGAAILAGAALATSGLARPPAPSLRPEEPGRPRLLDGLGLAAALLIAAAWWWLDGQSALLYRGGFWVTELAALVLVASCVRRPGGPIARALAIRPLRAMGLISYGVYLWHWPIYVVLTEGRLGFGGLRLLGLRLALTLAIAGVSYRYVERPIRERGLVWGRPIIMVPGAVALALAFVLASTRVVRAKPPVAKEGLAFTPSSRLPAVDAALRDGESDAAQRPAPMSVLVVGDSVGLSLGARMYWLASSAAAVVEQRAIGDCSILDGFVPVHSMSGEPHGNGNCAGSWVEDACELHPDITLIVIGGAYFSSVKAGGRWRGVCEDGWHDAYRKRLSALLDAIRPYTKRRVVLLAAYPVGKWQTPTLDDNVDCYNRILRDAAEASAAEILDLNAYVCPERRCVMTSHDVAVRPDGLHFDGRGAEETGGWVLAQLRAGEPDPRRPAP